MADADFTGRDTDTDGSIGVSFCQKFKNQPLCCCDIHWCYNLNLKSSDVPKKKYKKIEWQ